MLHEGLRLGGRYRLDARIGAGGMGEVWRAVDEVLDRVVAVKGMLPDVAGDPDFARRFLVEAKAMASVNHPAVASIHDYGRSGEVTYLVMEFVDGESVSQSLGRTGRLGAADTMRIVAQAADGLQAVHDRGIVHRDVKPANLLLRGTGSVVITDFGIARADGGTTLTVTGAILGTPTYLSPEQVLGQPATALSDVYSLGLTAYECLAGHRPFVGENPYAIALQRLRSAPRTIGIDLPRAVLDVVQRAVATDPADRWPSAEAMAEAARDAMSSSPARTGGRSVPVAGPVPAPPALPVSAAPVSVPSLAGPPVPGPPVPGSAGSPVAGVPASGARTGPVRPRRRWAVVGAAAIVVMVLVGGFALRTALTGGGRGNGSAADAAGPGTVAPLAPIQQAGFATCGAAFCPATPMCWGNLTSISGNAVAPRRIDCTFTHTWETFSAIYLPADAVGVSQDELMQRADIGTLCSASAMAKRSGDPGITDGWIREAWPVQITGTDLWILHCMAHPVGRNPSVPAFLTS